MYYYNTMIFMIRDEILSMKIAKNAKRLKNPIAICKFITEKAIYCHYKSVTNYKYIIYYKI